MTTLFSVRIRWGGGGCHWSEHLQQLWALLEDPRGQRGRYWLLPPTVLPGQWSRLAPLGTVNSAVISSDLLWKGAGWQRGVPRLGPGGRHHQEGDSPQGERAGQARPPVPGHPLQAQCNNDDREVVTTYWLNFTPDLGCVNCSWTSVLKTPYFSMEKSQWAVIILEGLHGIYVIARCEQDCSASSQSKGILTRILHHHQNQKRLVC